MNPKILFVTNRNVVTTCGELRLIKNRTQTLYEEHGIATDFLVLSRKRTETAEEIGYESDMTLVPFQTSHLFSFFRALYRQKKMLRRQAASRKYNVYMISGSLLFPLVRVIRRSVSDACVFADIHGALEELKEYKKGGVVSNALRRMLFWACKRNERKYLKEFDGALVVSEALRRYLQREYGYARSHVVPCAIHRFHITLERLWMDREAARKKYGIGRDDVLFVFSGGISPWQCIEESIRLFKRLKEESPDVPMRMLLLSGNRSAIEKYADQDIIIDSLSPADVVHVLPAGDFAFLLREDYTTNRVAYPNKFLEYVSAGLKVISTPYIEDVANQIVQYGVGYILQSMAYESKLTSYCVENMHAFGDDLENRQKLLNDTCFETTMRFFRDFKCGDV